MRFREVLLAAASLLAVVSSSPLKSRDCGAPQELMCIFAPTPGIGVGAGDCPKGKLTSDICLRDCVCDVNSSYHITCGTRNTGCDKNEMEQACWGVCTCMQDCPESKSAATSSSPLTPKDIPLTPRDAPLTPRDAPLTPRDIPLTPRDVPLTSRNTPLSDRDFHLYCRTTQVGTVWQIEMCPKAMLTNEICQSDCVCDYNNANTITCGTHTTGCVKDDMEKKCADPNEGACICVE